jgi:hypothetical protein
MTLDQAVLDTWEALGEPSDLDPTDSNDNTVPGSPGYLKLSRWIDEGLKALSTYKWPSGQRIRFRVLEKSCSFKTYYHAGNVPNGQSFPWSQLMVSGIGWTDARKNDIIRINNETRRIVSIYTQTNTFWVLDAPLSIDPTGDLLEIFRQKYNITLNTEPQTGDIGTTDDIAEILDVYRTSDQSSMLQSLRGVRNFNITLGTPGGYNKFGRAIEFDVVPMISEYYTIFYYAYPDIPNPTEQLTLPLPFHRAVVLYAIWIGSIRSMENTTAYARKKDYDDLMSHLRTEYDLESETQTSYAQIRTT